MRIFIRIIGFLLLLVLVIAALAKYNNMNINDVGLKVLGWVKKAKGDSVDLNLINPVKSQIVSHEYWTRLLDNHVTSDGKVNYIGFINDSTLLEKYLVDLSQNPPGKNWPEKEQIAYWINAYNAFTVKLIIDHYPLKSIKDISNGLPMINSPWDIKFFKIGDIEFDLNTIEHEILRKKYDEPRIHFAINCASYSCPMLRNNAFIANDLNSQLDEQARRFINNETKNIITNKEVKLSKIFDWFQSDFTKKKTLFEYIRYYNPSIASTTKIQYMDYDWSLNE